MVPKKSKASTKPGMVVEHGLLEGHVLQRRVGGARATVSGTCTVSGPVFACVRGADGRVCGAPDHRVGQARNGRFKAQLRGIPSGGPYCVTLRCGDVKIEVPDVFVGDLWLMAGQSNMEGNASMKHPAGPHPLVRCFTMARRWELAREPLHLLAESPDPVHGGNALSPTAAAQARRRATKGGGVGLHFAKEMLKRTGVPQGLIATAHGGSSMQQWHPSLRTRGGKSLYGSMRLSLRAVDQPLAGVLWYQGESEALPALTSAYTRRMKGLVSAVRRDAKQPALPWLTVQIARFIIGGYHDANGWPDPASWNRIQELQRLLPRVIQRLTVVPAVDLELDDRAHVASDAFPHLATRLADEACRLVHHDGQYRPPIAVRTVRYTTKPEPCITVSFANVLGRLRSAGPVRGFTLVDRERHALPAIRRVELRGARALLWLTSPALVGLRLQYGQGLDPLCTIVDDRNRAVPVFGPLQITTPL